MATNDTMTGSIGNDIYYVDSVADKIIEKFNEGIDLVNSSVTYTLSNNIEKLTLTGISSINGTGNNLDNSIVGNSGVNTLIGGAGNDSLNAAAGADAMIGGIGNDVYYVDNLADVVVENENEGIDIVNSSVTFALGNGLENLTLTGSAAINGVGNSLSNTIIGTTGVNILTGAAGDDFLNGGSGADTMIGGVGNDNYYVDNTSDVVTENSGEGIDTVNSSATYTLGNNLENLLLTGTSAVSATGNSLNNNITGNGGINTLSGGVGNDTLNGGGSADRLIGGVGDDVYYVDNTSDIIVENANEGIETVNSSATYTLATNVENLVLTGTALINGTGNASNNTITGNSAINTINGGTGADTMIGALGNDLYYVDNVADVVIENQGEGVDTVSSSVSYTLNANVESLILSGTSAINAVGNDSVNTITGNSGVNTLSGAGGNDILNGAAGADKMFGGVGDDFYYVDNTLDLVSELADEGIDTVNSSLTYTLSSNVENLILSGTSTVHGTGNSSNNVITGNHMNNTLIGAAGNDTLIGGAGNDTMIGGVGNDSYYVDNSSDIVSENLNEGVDTVNSTIGYTLAGNIENLTLVGTLAVNGVGNSFDNVMIGNSGKNTLSGGLGNDTLNGGVGLDSMVGGVGDDAYYVDNSGDVVIENLGEGVDTVNSSISYTLKNNFEKLTLVGASNISAVGNAYDNLIIGNSGLNTLSGGIGNDTLNGGAGADTLIGGVGNDVYYVDNTKDVITEKINEGVDNVNSSVSYSLGLNIENLTLTGSENITAAGNSLNNTIIGNNANNTLIGGFGVDTMIGALGDDSYYVENALDIIVENASEGADTVNSSINYTLGANLEKLNLLGTALLNGSGNELDNSIVGNSAKNILTGEAGNDTLNGAAGADTMIGGVGNDSYYVDNTGDVLTENENEGIDTVYTSLDYSLGSNIENLTMTGTSALKGTGNSLDNYILGNSGANLLSGALGNDTLNGGAGIDTLQGGAGDDSYYVDNLKDVITEKSNEGTDTLYSSIAYTLSANVENFVLLGDQNVGATGNASDNVITGNSGDNSLNGAVGKDTLIGGLGDDTYYVDNADDVAVEAGAEGVDTINSSVNYTLSSNVENLTLIGASKINGVGNELDNLLTGNDSANSLSGGIGNDTLNGAAGIDTLIGGLGNDTYYVDNASDTIVENENEGVDTVNSSISYTLNSNTENLNLLGSTAINATGNELNNVLRGNGANNVLNGGGGADTLIGGAGDDSYLVDNQNDIIIENENEGTDLVQSSATYTLAGNLEKLTLLGAGNINATGNDLDNVLTGNSGVNTLSGGLGNDSYYVENASAVIVESLGEGDDNVNSSVTYTLGANVESLTLIGSENIDAHGNSADNSLKGNSAKNTLFGGLGNDNYYIDDSQDVVVENLNEGIDKVNSSITYSLTSGVENLSLTGAAAINATGNELGNIITGNGANNVLNGGEGADTLIGGLGNDSYLVDNSNDVIIENSNEGFDVVEASASYTLGANVENLTLIGAGNINASGNDSDNVLTGNGGTNTLSGGNGNDSLNGADGADVLVGGSGNDNYYVENALDSVVELQDEGLDVVNASVTYTLSSNVERLTLIGSENINGFGNSSDNTLTGNSGLNTLSGGLGNDTYFVYDNSDVIVENVNAGIDTINSSVSYTLSGNVENLGLTGSALIDATGNSLDNFIEGNSSKNTLTGALGNDTLSGGGGADLMIGGLGNDSYYVDNILDVVTELENEGQDSIYSSASYTLGTNLENVILGGSSLIDATGNALDNKLFGNSARNSLSGGAGNDLLNGGGGADVMLGGSGDDLYFVDNVGDIVTDSLNDGFDTVVSSTNYTLGNNIENLVLEGSTAVSATGNNLDNLITGNGLANTLNGGTGSDTLIGASGNDVYFVDSDSDVIVENADEGDDTVNSSSTYTLSSNVENLSLTGSAAVNAYGNASANNLAGNNAVNTLSGEAGDDTLNGGLGADSLIGGVGNDSYIVDNIGDVVVENTAEGIDAVQSFVTYSLGANLENITLLASAKINAVGNDLDNLIIGNSAVNTLSGGIGSDTLNGGAGADKMLGGVGDDTYYVDNASDLVSENLNEGNDSINSSVSYILGNNLEKLTLSGTAAINATGNSIDNLLVGNDAVNTLNGGLGLDTMIGALGNDTYFVDNSGDVVVENLNEGTDVVNSLIEYTLGDNVENLILLGKALINGNGNNLDNFITGNMAANTLNGFDGNDTLNGSAGADTMIGGIGNDTYYADNAADLISEYQEEGTDTVNSSVSYTLGENIENLTLIGTAAITATGNDLDNVLVGNSGKNVLIGAEGDDVLNGAANSDKMIGGIGNDSYFVDNASDIVVENLDEGIDIVNSSISYTLVNNVENLTLQGNSIINGTGNALDNLIVGNSAKNLLTGAAGDDILDGGANADKMIGGVGNDTYYVENVWDVVVENANEGIDTINSSMTYSLGSNFENLTLSGSDDIDATGNELDNVLTSNGGNNVLSGKDGNDTYLFNLGDKLDKIIDSAGADSIIFGEGVEINTIAFFQDDSGLYIDYGDSVGVDQIFISDWGTAGNQVESIQLNNGNYITNTKISQIIQDMSAYSASNGVDVSSISAIKGNAELMELYMNSAWSA